MQINYQKHVATLNNLPDVLIRNPYVLHFSGHGLKNCPEQIGQEAVLHKGDGHMLLFEDDKLWGVLLSEKDLKNLLQQCRTNIKVAVVLSCHSEFIGQIFYNAGIKHVICIKDEYEISDSASIIFAGTFYKLLFSENYNICTAFMAAKTQVQVQGSVGCNVGEDTKFILKCDHPPHLCPRKTLSLKKGVKKLINHTPKLKKLPADVEQFIGRQVECKTIVEKLNKTRYISIEGPSGIGKSAIVKKIANLLFEREYMRDGILYMSLKDWNSLEAFLKKMYMSVKFFIENNTKLQKDKEQEFPDVDKIYWELLSMFKDLQWLIIFDNWNEPNMFKDFFQDFLEKLPNIKIIITCVHSILRFDDVGGYIYKVKELSKKQTLELLKLKSESHIDHNRELKELMDIENSNHSSKKSILDHPIFDFLGGHPLSIDILSSLRKNMCLVEIYELLQLIKSNYKDTVIDQSQLALTLSVEASLVFLNKEDKNWYNILIHFAICPSGLIRNDVISMFEDKKYESKPNNFGLLLISSSLLK